MLPDEGCHGRMAPKEGCDGHVANGFGMPDKLSDVAIRPAARPLSLRSSVSAWPVRVRRLTLKATAAAAPSPSQSTTQGQASGNTAHRATPRPRVRHACCRMSMHAARIRVNRRAVSPRVLVRSSVLASARSRACTHASCPWRAAIIRAVTPLLDCRSGLAECSRSRSRMER
eukprot:scaffold98312_cov69-Phaeocystis_antarctica.AAC.1